MRTNLLFAAVPALVPAVALPAQYFEARNMGMGGTGIASSRYLAAGFANPALLTRFEGGDHVGVILPAVGAIAYDKTQLIDDVKKFADDYDRISGNGSATPQDIVNLAAELQALSGRPVNGNLGVGFAVAVPSTDLAWSLHLHSWLDLQAVVQIDPNDIIAIGTTTPGNALPALNSEARILGAAVSELGLSLATRFEFAGGPALSIGATPKLQRVDTYNYSVNINNFDQNNFDDSQYRNDKGAFNLDLGASFEPFLGLTFAAMARDLIAQDYDTVTTIGERFSYRVQPNLSLGAAWEIGALTLAADVELIERERFKDQTLALTSLRIEDNVQTLHLGAELGTGGWIQLRGGVEVDMQGTLDNAWTAGVGLAPFDLLHVDIAGLYVDQNSFGGVVQLSFTF